MLQSCSRVCAELGMVDFVHVVPCVTDGLFKIILKVAQSKHSGASVTEVLRHAMSSWP